MLQMVASAKESAGTHCGWIEKEAGPRIEAMLARCLLAYQIGEIDREVRTFMLDTLLSHERRMLRPQGFGLLNSALDAVQLSPDWKGGSSNGAGSIGRYYFAKKKAIWDKLPLGLHDGDLLQIVDRLLSEPRQGPYVTALEKLCERVAKEPGRDKLEGAEGVAVGLVGLLYDFALRY
jgi:hypothetical protein